MRRRALLQISLGVSIFMQQDGGAMSMQMTDDQHPRGAGNYGFNYRRLAQLKKKYDPTNQFLLNASIRPA